MKILEEELRVIGVSLVFSSPARGPSLKERYSRGSITMGEFNFLHELLVVTCQARGNGGCRCRDRGPQRSQAEAIAIRYDDDVRRRHPSLGTVGIGRRKAVICFSEEFSFTGVGGANNESSPTLLLAPRVGGIGGLRMNDTVGGDESVCGRPEQR